MKISDCELLDSIWINQLKNVAECVVHNYVGGKFGLCVDDDYWFESMSWEHICSRENVTSKIGKQQLLHRIRNLNSAGKIKLHRGLVFFIDSDVAREAFRFSRKFFLEKGIPEGFENGAARTVKIQNIDELRSECHRLLVGEFPSWTKKVK